MTVCVKSAPKALLILLLAKTTFKLVVEVRGDLCGAVEHTIFGSREQAVPHEHVVLVTCGDYYPGLHFNDSIGCFGVDGLLRCATYLNAVYAAEHNYTFAFYKYDSATHGVRAAIWCRVLALRAAVVKFPGAAFLYLDLDAFVVTNMSISFAALVRTGRHRALILDADPALITESEFHSMRGIQNWFESENTDSVLISRDVINAGILFDIGPDASISAFLDFWWSIGEYWTVNGNQSSLKVYGGDQRALSIALGLRRDVRRDVLILKTARDEAAKRRGSVDLFGGPDSQCIRHYLGGYKNSGEAQASVTEIARAARRRMSPPPGIEML